MDLPEIWTLGDQEFRGIIHFRNELRAFLQLPEAAALLEADLPAQQSILAAFERHYHWDAASGLPPTASEVRRVVVQQHPKWGSPCFALVLGDEQEAFRFSMNKLKSTQAPPRSGALAPTASTPSQARKNVNEALRAGVQDVIQVWEDENPPPPTCPVTGIPLGPMSQRTDPIQRYAENTPTVDHHDPTLKVRIDNFLEAEGLLPNGVPLTKSALTGGWVLSDNDMLQRWRESHGTGGLRWVSLHGNREENRRNQQSI
jgi:hypothetical protein